MCLLFLVHSYAQTKDKYENYVTCSYKDGRKPYYDCLISTEVKLTKLIDLKYKQILKELNKQILECSKANCGKEELESYINQKNNFKTSQKKWSELKYANSAFYWDIIAISNVNYAESLVKDSLDRLKYLDKLLEQIQ